MKISDRLTRSRIEAGIKRRLHSLGVFLPIRQVERIGQPGHKLLIVAAGTINIPSQGWGAVEKIIYETIDYYVKAGFEVTLLNSKHREDWRKLTTEAFDIILCHEDSMIKRISKFFKQTPIVIVTHYGYLPVRSKWDESFKQIMRNFELANHIIALSPDCYSELVREFPHKRISICPNGLIPSSYKESATRSRCIYLGKIENRKKQLEIANKYPDLPIDFVGPGAQDEGINSEKNTGVRFLGPKDRNWLQQNLNTYKIGILLSESEADALVAYEYQDAGLHVILSKGAVGSQNEDLPWIQVAGIEDLRNSFDAAAASSVTDEEISDYAKLNYSWDSRIKNYLTVIQKEMK